LCDVVRGYVSDLNVFEVFEKFYEKYGERLKLNRQQTNISNVSGVPKILSLFYQYFDNCFDYSDQNYFSCIVYPYMYSRTDLAQNIGNTIHIIKLANNIELLGNNKPESPAYRHIYIRKYSYVEFGAFARVETKLLAKSFLELLMILNEL
jgi:hypothetical protein